MDLPEAAEKLEHFKGRYRKLQVVPIIAETGEGVEKLKSVLAEMTAGPSETATPA